jgi:ribosomal silencing factor RsfS
MTINTRSELLIVPPEIIETLVKLKSLLILYVGISKHEEQVIDLLTIEIDLIREERRDNFFIEKLISEHNYPREFDQEEIKEFLEVESFFIDHQSR